MSKIAYLFPGQGSQYVGMAKDFYQNYVEVKDLYDKVSKLMNKDIAKISFQGPEDVLKQTDNTQLSIVLHSLSVFKVLQKEQILPLPTMVAGHSVGQYSALIASDVLSLEDGLSLLLKRANFMLSDCRKVKTSMTAVIGMKLEKIKEIIDEFQDVYIANINSDMQVVIGGELLQLEKAEEKLKISGAKKVIRLKVSGAFHTPFMKDAADKLAKEIDKFKFSDAKFYIVSNVYAKPLKKADEIKESLKKQIISKVMWKDTITIMLESGIDTFIELGPGKVLTGLVKKMTRRLKNVKVYNIDTFQDFINFKKNLAIV